LMNRCKPTPRQTSPVTLR